MIKVRRLRYLDNQNKYLRLTSCISRLLTKVNEINSITRFYKFCNNRDDLINKYHKNRSSALLTNTRHSSDTITFRMGNIKLHSVLIV